MLDTKVPNAQQQLVTVLSNSIQFHGIDPARLEKIAATAQLRHWAAGETVYDIGSPADAIYIILSGQADYIYAPDAARKLGPRIEAGDIAGWAALLKSRPKRPGKIVAKTELEAAVVPADALVAIFRDDPVEWNAIVGRFAMMVSREYGLPTHFAEIQKEIDELEAGAYAMEKMLIRHKMGRAMPARRKVNVEERFKLIQAEHEILARKAEFDPRQMARAWLEAEALIDQMFEVTLPVKNTNNLPNWG